MQTQVATTASADRTDPPELPRRLWRLAGAFALAHVVVSFGAIALQRAPLFQEGTAGIQRAYVEGNLALSVAGGLLGAFGFLLLIPALVFLARAFGTRTEAGRWAAQTALMSGMGYVIAALAVGFPAGAAAMYGAQDGLDVEVAFALNNLRVFAYFLSLFLLGAHAIALAVAALQDGTRTRWIGWGGLVTGVLLIASVPLAPADQQDLGTVVWLVWWIGVALSLLRHQPTTASCGRPPAAEL